jgi:hypothetical protein
VRTVALITAVSALVAAASCGSSTGNGLESAAVDASSDSQALDASIPGTFGFVPDGDGCDPFCSDDPMVDLLVVGAQGSAVLAPTFSTAGQPLKPRPLCLETVDLEGGSFYFASSADGGEQGDAGDGGSSNCDVWVLMAPGYPLSTILVSAPGYEPQTVTVTLSRPTGCTCGGPYGRQIVTLFPSDGSVGEGGSPADAAPSSDGDVPSGD